ncbi:hypothetical protein Tco_0058775 [Tanacetum coccineum]
MIKGDERVVFVMADINNLDTYFQVSHVPTTRINKDHLLIKSLEICNLDTYFQVSPVPPANLVLLVQKLPLLVLKVNAAGLQVTTAERLQLLKG